MKKLWITLVFALLFVPLAFSTVLANAEQSALLLGTATVRPTDTRWPTATVRPTDTRWPTATSTPTKTPLVSATPTVTFTPSVTATTTFTPVTGDTATFTATPEDGISTATPTSSSTPTSIILLPIPGSTPPNLRPTFDWADIPGATSYNLVVSRYASYAYPLINISSAASTYTPGVDLPRNTLLYWRVRANLPNAGPWVTSTFKSPNPPYPPVLSSPANNALLTVYTPKLDWLASTLPTGVAFGAYQLEVDDNPDFSSPILARSILNAGSHEYAIPTALDANTTFYWRVRTLNSLGQYAAWSTRSFRTALPAPSLVPLSPPRHLRPSVDWSDVPGATGYGLVMSIYSNFASPFLSVALTSSEYTLKTDLPRNYTIYWRVRAQGTNISAWSSSSFKSPNPPYAVTLLSPAVGAVTSLTPKLDWAAVTLPGGTVFAFYQLQVDDNADFSSPVFEKTFAPITNHLYTITDPTLLLPGTIYYWRVRGVNSMPHFGPWTTRSFKTYIPTATPTVTFTPTPTLTPTSTPTPTSLPGTPIDSPAIRQLQMVNTFSGWAIDEARILRTGDGGLHWFDVTMPGVDLGGLLVSAQFIDTDNGWVLINQSEIAAGSIFHTTNGGVSWSRSDTPFGGGLIRFTNASTGYVLTITGAAMNKQSVEVYKTANGGASWVRQYTNDPTTAGYSSTLPLGGHKTSLAVPNGTMLWIGGDSPAAGQVYLYKSIDSGVSWALKTLTLPTGYSTAYVNTAGVSFFGASDGILPVWLGTSAGRDLFIYTTHDAGSTWSRSTAYTRGAENADFVSMTDAFGWDWNGTFHVTHNAGASWSIVTPNVDFTGSYRGMDFVSASTGWVLTANADGATSLYRTTDGAVTWNLLSTSPIPTPTVVVTPSPAIVESIDVQIVEDEPLQALATIKGRLPDDGCTTIAGVNQLRSGNIFTFNISTNFDTAAQCNQVATPFERVETLYTTGLPIGQYVINAGSISHIFKLVTREPAKFSQLIVDKLNAKDFSTAKILMGEFFGFAYWQSEGNGYPPEDAIQVLQNAYIGANTTLIPNPDKDLTTLLYGANPYAIMGLDPASAQALFVSGWGLDGKGEAILYARRLEDGSLFWHSVLVAPTKFLPGTGPYAVISVASTDVLNVRAGAGVSNPIISTLEYNATGIFGTGHKTMVGSDAWAEIQIPSGGTGWVNAYYLTEQVSPQGFAADSRPLAIISSLKDALNTQNGTLFASLVNPRRGLSISYWQYNTPIVYSAAQAASIFSSTTSFDWGPGPGGSANLVGTFTDAMRPKLLDVFNASYVTEPNGLSYISMYPNPWPFSLWNYYNVYRPGTPGIELDWRAWLAGFEYIDGKPYLTALRHVTWEP